MYTSDTNIRKKRRQKIVDAAKKLFEKQGIAQTTLIDIATEVGMGRSTVYEYFATREELLLYIRELYMEEMYNFELPFEDRQTGIEQLEHVLMKYFDMMLEKPAALMYFMEYNRYRTTDENNHEPEPVNDYTSYVYLQNAILKGRLDGTLLSEGIEKKVTMVVEALLGAATRFAVREEYSYSDRPVTVNKNDMRQLVHIMLNGING